MIPVTKPGLPDLTKVKKYLDDIYERRWFTNNGPLVQLLTERLEEYLGIENLLLVANGTLALQVAYRALGVEGEAITTPFTFVATASSLSWEGIKPVFSDIDPESFNLCPTKILEKITKNTNAIVPVHVYGAPCNVEHFERIAEQKNLKLIYDASHAFGVNHHGSSLLSYGDASTLSFHATKIFHTVEGGGVVFRDKEVLRRAQSLINFGFSSDGEITGVGINAKMSEIHAAFGLSLLDDIDGLIARRVEIQELYQTELNGFVQFQQRAQESNLNGSYLPIVLASKEQRKTVELRLNFIDVKARRYFSPSLNMTRPFCDVGEKDLPRSEDISSRVLCLPLYYELSDKDVLRICENLKRAIG
ncbi:DegT/DnrJ/EryC1/StrS family aminotransferase [Marinobacter sp. KMM 10035]|uniref:DegT/DnrJ/EryC1/StrS family aminotransferase n=1 Tax=Marinobacter sp. KMM 10035 TaxID=3134034 RepID=UPI00397B1B80